MRGNRLPSNEAVRLAVRLSIGLCILLGCQTPAPKPSIRATREIEVEPIEAQVARLARESRPIREHQGLDVLTGSWTLELVAVDSRGGEQSLAQGEAEIAWILGGRFLHWDASLLVGGRAERTTGYLGFDLNIRQYQLLMISSLASGMTVAQGNGDISGNGIKFEVEQLDPATGVRRRMSSILRALSRAHFVLDQLGQDAAGAERIVRRSHYRRHPPVDSRSDQDLAPSNAPDPQGK